jgi:hypothetical protein
LIEEGRVDLPAMSDYLIPFVFLLLALLVVAAYVTLYRRQRAHRRSGTEEAIGSLPCPGTPGIVDLHDAPTHGTEEPATEGGGQFGGAGASEGYDSGGGFDSGDGGDGGGGDGGD